MKAKETISDTAMMLCDIIQLHKERGLTQEESFRELVANAFRRVTLTDELKENLKRVVKIGYES